MFRVLTSKYAYITRGYSSLATVVGGGGREEDFPMEPLENGRKCDTVGGAIVKEKLQGGHCIRSLLVNVSSSHHSECSRFRSHIQCAATTAGHSDGENPPKMYPYWLWFQPKAKEGKKTPFSTSADTIFFPPQ